MRSKKKVIGMILVVVFMLSLFAQSTFATTYGTEDASYTWIPAVAFNQIGAQYTMLDDGGYIYRTDGSQSFYAPVNLPSGVKVEHIELFYYRGDKAPGPAMYFLRNNTKSNETDGLGMITGVLYGYQTRKLEPEINFDNYHQYVIRVNLPSVGSDNMFKGVRIKYSRRISLGPKPGFESFNDVLFGHPFYHEIEALARSGITAGWPDGTFRPNEPVTRQAMAAFLARALGLHHPDSD